MSGPRPRAIDRVVTADDQGAYAAALAGLPGMGPATLRSILSQFSPRQAWAEVCRGRIVRPAAKGEDRPARPARPGDSLHADPGSAGSAFAGAGFAGAGGGGAGVGGAGVAGLGGGGLGAAQVGNEVSGWEGRAGGRGPGAERSRPPRPWVQISRQVDPCEWWAPHARRGCRVTWWQGPDFPGRLVDDPSPPGVLFWRGSIEFLDRTCVAVVGTRNATPEGRASAYRLGQDLAAAGICVVSGLALGIDGAAHAGALAALAQGAPATTVGVAASGPDIVYPRRHASLWADVTRHGAVISENPPGRPAQAWRFPTRNRLIAGLVSLVVIVESRLRGGSLHTAEAALERGVEVRVVPGSVHSPASEGTNQLLYDGAGPVRDARDVLDALGMFQSVPPSCPPRGPGKEGRRVSGGAGPTASGSAGGAVPAIPADDLQCRRVLEAVGATPVTTEQILIRTGLDAAAAARCLDRLVEAGRLDQRQGWWMRPPR